MCKYEFSFFLYFCFDRSSSAVFGKILYFFNFLKLLYFSNVFFKGLLIISKNCKNSIIHHGLTFCTLPKPIEIQITAHHQGFFEFKLCKIGSDDTTENVNCFDSADSVLELENGGNRYTITDYFPSKQGESGWLRVYIYI